MNPETANIVNVKHHPGSIASGAVRAADRILSDLFEGGQEEAHLTIAGRKPAVEGSIEEAVGHGTL